MRGELSWEGTAKIRAILSNMHGALLEKQIDGSRTGNLDELRLLRRKRSQPMKPKTFKNAEEFTRYREPNRQAVQSNGFGRRHNCL